MKFTKRSVEALEVKTSRYIEWDDALVGFGCRVSPSGGKIFLVDYVIHAKRRRMSLGKFGVLTVDEARQLARSALAQVAHSKDPMSERDRLRNDITVGELCDHYLDVAVAHKRLSTVTTDISNIESHIKPVLGKKSVIGLSQTDVRKFYRDVCSGKTEKTEKTKSRGVRRVRGGIGTANRALAVLSAIFSFSIESGLRADNPVSGVKPIKLESRERFLTSEEFQSLATAIKEMEKAGDLHPYSAPIIRLLLLTGARRSEICAARWNSVDLERGILTVPKGKTGRRHVRLAPAAIQIFSEIPKCSEWVFPAKSTDAPYRGLPKQWRAIRKRADLEDVRLHDLRHTFASIAVQGGASLYLVQSLLGHADSSMTQKYAHLAEDPISDVNNAVANKVVALLG